MSRIAVFFALLAVSTPVIADDAPVSPQACRLMIEAGKAQFDHAWDETWRNGELPRFRESVRRIQAALTPEQRELIRAHEKGHIKFAFLESILRPAIAAGECRQECNPNTLSSSLYRVNEPVIQLDIRNTYGNRLDILTIKLADIESKSADEIMRNALALRVGKHLGAEKPVASASEYIRKHLKLPPSCNSEPISVAARNEADERLAVLPETEGSSDRGAGSATTDAAI